MKNRIVDYIVDNFVDYANVERKFIVAAVSVPYTTTVDGKEVVDKTKRTLSLGFAICNPSDEFDENLGLKIAVSRAENKDNKLTLIANTTGLINTPMVKALLEQEATYFKNNPESRINGYNEAKRKYEEAIANKQKYDALVASLSDEEKSIIEKYKALGDEFAKLNGESQKKLEYLEYLSFITDEMD